MTIPKFEAPVNTIHDFLAKDLMWSGISDGWIMSIENSTEVGLTLRFHIFYR